MAVTIVVALVAPFGVVLALERAEAQAVLAVVLVLGSASRLDLAGRIVVAIRSGRLPPSPSSRWAVRSPWIEVDVETDTGAVGEDRDEGAASRSHD